MSKKTNKHTNLLSYSGLQSWDLLKMKGPLLQAKFRNKPFAKHTANFWEVGFGTICARAANATFPCGTIIFLCTQSWTVCTCWGGTVVTGIVHTLEALGALKAPKSSAGRHHWVSANISTSVAAAKLITGATGIT